MKQKTISICSYRIFTEKKSKHLIFGLSGLKTPLTQVTAEKHETQELHIKALQTWRPSNKTFASW